MIKKIMLLTVLTMQLLACSSNNHQQKIGIIVPIEHQALTEIVNGFVETLKKQYPAAEFKIANAQGDMNLQRAIIQQMQDQDYAMLVPVGTGAAQMTLQMVHQKPVVSLAADIEQHAAAKCHVAIVHDEIKPQLAIDFIHASFPQLKNITLIYSATDKIYPQVAEAIAAGKKNGMTITGKMVMTLSDLYSTANNLAPNTQAIFILKDNLVASGISTLIKVAKDHHLALLTSDEATVETGAAFALGVHEKQIGVEGGLLAAQILDGKKPCELPTVEMRKLTVFMNAAGLQAAGLEAEALQKTATQYQYPIEITTAQRK